MRLNVFLAQSSSLSRRSADAAISSGRVAVNGQSGVIGQTIETTDEITLDGRSITLPLKAVTIVLNKPAGYVCSRNGQGSKTVYDLLPQQLHNLKPVGRLDKDSSGLLVLTNDGQLANELTHPKYQKTKVYEIELNSSLAPLHQQMISDHGIGLKDGLSRLLLEKINGDSATWQVTMHEGRNRQIRRTFAALGYDVIRLHRTKFGNFMLSDQLATGGYTVS